jgi:hypothetical protein
MQKKAGLARTGRRAPASDGYLDLVLDEVPMTVAETAVPVIRRGDPQVRRRPRLAVPERDQDLAAVSRSADQAACCRLAHRPTYRNTGPDNHDVQSVEQGVHYDRPMGAGVRHDRKPLQYDVALVSGQQPQVGHTDDRCPRAGFRRSGQHDQQQSA